VNDKTLIKIEDRFQITLPPEVLQALNVDVGDYLEAKIVEDSILLKPAFMVEQAKARDTTDIS
jgi:bifunctional DNA-binding transcriptional regulator/antitoxin component of YhaV-PrlF toxin-antitoxin module